MAGDWVSFDYDGTVEVSAKSVLRQISIKQIKEYLSAQTGEDVLVGDVKRFIDDGQTEEVKEIYDHIVGSWHFDTAVFADVRGK